MVKLLVGIFFFKAETFVFTSNLYVLKSNVEPRYLENVEKFEMCIFRCVCFLLGRVKEKTSIR
jgi:hypothetical protein